MTARSNKLFEAFTIVTLLAVQVLFWNGISLGEGDDKNIIWEGTRSKKPDMSIVPTLPDKYVRKAISLGDDQFFFRAMAFNIQNAGDTFGRTTSLRNYDYSKLYQWWLALDEMDSKSDFVPSLVSYYYGGTPNQKEQIPYVVDYLEQHADKDPAKKWWWYNQAAYHAKHKLKDLDRAISIADKMYNLPEDTDAPIWARQMKAFFHEDRGELNESCHIILNILDSYKDISEGELNFIHHFITERLDAMAKHKNKNEIDPRCLAIIEAQKKNNTISKKK